MDAEFIAGAVGKGLNSFMDSYTAAQDRTQKKVQSDELRALKRREQKLKDFEAGVKYNDQTQEYERPPGMLSKSDRDFENFKRKETFHEGLIRARPKPDRPERQPSEGQAKAGGFSLRMESAMKAMDNLEAGGFDRAKPEYDNMETAGDVPLVGGYIRKGLPEGLIKQGQAERDFLNAVLRKESGSAISTGEFTSGRAQYFPRAGDTPDVKEQKRQNRINALAGIESESGGKYMGRVRDTQKKLQSSFSRGQSSPDPAGTKFGLEDFEAIAWAKKNRNDPRSKKILELHGL